MCARAYEYICGIDNDEIGSVTGKVAFGYIFLNVQFREI